MVSIRKIKDGAKMIEKSSESTATKGMAMINSTEKHVVAKVIWIDERSHKNQLIAIAEGVEWELITSRELNVGDFVSCYVFSYNDSDQGNDESCILYLQDKNLPFSNKDEWQKQEDNQIEQIATGSQKEAITDANPEYTSITKIIKEYLGIYDTRTLYVCAKIKAITHATAVDKFENYLSNIKGLNTWDVDSVNLVELDNLDIIE